MDQQIFEYIALGFIFVFALVMSRSRRAPTTISNWDGNTTSHTSEATLNHSLTFTKLQVSALLLLATAILILAVFAGLQGAADHTNILHSLFASTSWNGAPNSTSWNGSINTHSLFASTSWNGGPLSTSWNG